MNIDKGEFARALRATMLLGAARWDCAGDPDRLAALRELKEPLQAFVQCGDYRGAEQLVRSVMPVGWEPGESWRIVD